MMGVGKSGGGPDSVALWAPEASWETVQAVQVKAFYPSGVQTRATFTGKYLNT